jgi:hypothetical protein
MILLAHVLLALSTVFASILIVLFPTHIRITITKLLTAATLLSGTYLVFQNSSKLVSSCLYGLVIVCVSYAATKRATMKLAQQEV